MRRNDKVPEAVGRVLLKEIHPKGDEADTWLGEIYAQRLKEYKQATITLTDPDTMEITVKAGFMRRTVKWSRSAGLPER